MAEKRFCLDATSPFGRILTHVMVNVLVRALLVLMALGMIAPEPIYAGVVQTADGVIHQGTVTFSSGRVVIHPAIGPSIHLDPEDVLAITFDADRHGAPPRDALPSPWASRDIGKIGLNGKAIHQNGTFQVWGAGGGIGGREDAFHFVHQPVGDPTEITARVLSMQNTHERAKAGIMLRESLAPHAPYVMLRVTPTGEVALERRLPGEPGEEAEVIRHDRVRLPVWLRLRQRANRWQAEYSEDNQRWQTLDTLQMPMRATRGGLIVVSHDATRLCAAQFDQVEVYSKTAEVSPEPAAELVLLHGGVVLRDGRVITGDVRAMHQDTLHIGRPQNVQWRVPVSQVAQLILQPLTQRMTEQLLPDRNGVLLQNGDFLEGEVTILPSGDIRVSSILYGLQTLKRDQMSMIILAAADEPQAPVVVRAADGSVWVSDRLTLEQDAILIRDPLAGDLMLTARQLHSIEAFKDRTRSLLTIQPSLSKHGLVVGTPMAVNKSITGYPFRLGRQSIATGITAAGNVALNFTLDRPCRALICSAGIAADQSPLLRGHLVILGDGRELYRSPAIATGDPARLIGISLEGVQTLTLRIEAADNQALCPAAIWANPLLVIE